MEILVSSAKRVCFFNNKKGVGRGEDEVYKYAYIYAYVKKPARSPGTG